MKIDKNRAIEIIHEFMDLSLPERSLFRGFRKNQTLFPHNLDDIQRVLEKIGGSLNVNFYGGNYNVDISGLREPHKCPTCSKTNYDKTDVSCNSGIFSEAFLICLAQAIELRDPEYLK